MLAPWKIVAVEFTGYSTSKETAAHLTGKMQLKLGKQIHNLGFVAGHRYRNKKEPGFHANQLHLIDTPIDYWDVTYTPEHALKVMWEMEKRNPVVALTVALQQSFRKHIEKCGVLGQLKKLWKKKVPAGPFWKFQRPCGYLLMGLTIPLSGTTLRFSAYNTPESASQWQSTGISTAQAHITVNMLRPVDQTLEFNTPEEAVRVIRAMVRQYTCTAEKGRLPTPELRSI
jgi:hypothetical protein